MSFLKKARLSPTPEINSKLQNLGTSAIRKSVSLDELLKRPQVSLKDLKTWGRFYFFSRKIGPSPLFQQIEIEVKYSGFIQRQVAEVEKFKHLEKIKLPQGLDYSKVPSLSREIREKLNKFKPLNLGQASRISGVTPVAISLLMVYLKKLGDGSIFFKKNRTVPMILNG